MAKTIKGITIELGANTVGLDKALSDVNKRSKDLQTELKQVDKLLKFNPGNSDLVAQKQKLLADQVSSTADKLSQLKEAQKQVDQQFASGKIDAEQYRAFEREVIATQGALDGLKNKLANLEKEQQDAAKATKHLDTLFEATGSSVDDFADALGNKLTNAIKNGTASSKDLENAIEKIGKSTLGTNADIDKLRQSLASIDNGASVDKIKKDLKGLAKAANDAEKDVDGLGDKLKGLAGAAVAGGGIAGVIDQALDTSSLNTKIDVTFNVPEESKKSVREAVRGIEAYGIDAEAALSGVQRQWALNKDASDATNQAIIEQAGVISSAFEGIDFNELIQESYEMGKSMGISQEEALGLTNSLLKLGFPAEQLDIISEYGTQLKNAGYNAEEIQSIMAAGVETGTWNIDNLLDGLKEGRIRVAEFGQEVPKSLDNLLEKTNLSSQQMQKWGQDVATGGEKGSKALTNIAQWLTTVKDETLRNALGVEIFGTMYEDQGKNITDTLVNASEKTSDLKKNQEDLNSSVEKMNADPAVKMKQAVADLKESLQPLLSVIADVVGAIAGWVSENPKIAGTIAAIISVIGILVGAAAALAPIFTAIATVMGTAGVAFGAIATPIGIAIVAIGAIVAAASLIISNWEPIKGFFAGLWKGITTLFKASVNGISKLISTIFNGIISFFKKWGTTALAALTGPVGLMVLLISKNWGKIKSTTISIFNAVSKFIASIFTTIKGVVTNVTSTIWTTIKNGFGKILTTVTTIMGKVYTAIKTAWDKAVNFIKGINLFSIGKNVMSGLLKGITNGAKAIYNKAKEIAGNVLKTFKKIFDIHSPSRETEKIGKHVDEGLHKGLKKHGKMPVKTAAKIAAETKRAFGDGLKNIKLHLDAKSISAAGAINELERLKSRYRGVPNAVAQVNKEIYAISAKHDKAMETARKQAASKAKKDFNESFKNIKLRLDSKSIDSAGAIKELEKLKKKYRSVPNAVATINKEIFAINKKYEKELEELRKKAFEREKKRIEDKKYYNQLSLTQELKTYEKNAKKYKKGSEERQFYEKEAYRVKKEINEKLVSLNNDYTQKVTEANKKLIDGEKQLRDEYKKAVDERTKSLYSFAGIFDEVNIKADVSGAELITNLQSQVNTFAQWTDNVASLAARGIDKGLISELQEMGPNAAAEVAALTTLTDDELKQYASLWKEKNVLARNEATKELSGMNADTKQKIIELRTETNKELEGYRHDWIAKIKEIRTGTKDELDMNATLKSIGKNSFKGFLDGMKDMSNPIVKEAQKMAKSISNAINGSLQVSAIGTATSKVKSPKIPGFAKGTNYFSGGYALVGEQGAELVELPQGSKVHNNNDTRDMMSGGVVISGNNFTIREESDIKKVARELFNLQQQKNRGRGR